MLQAYRIIGRGFHVGAGALLLVSFAQAAERAHKIEPVGKPGAGFGLVRSKEVQAFKAGELLGLAELPKGQMHLVEEMPPKRGKKDDPEVLLTSAVSAFNAAAEEAELQQQQLAAEAAENKRLKEAAAAADAVDVATWTQEFNTLPGVMEKYGKVESYIAERRAERDKAAA